jgi:O-antigen ligase
VYLTYLLIGLVLGLNQKRGGFFLFLLLVPLTPNLHNQLAALFGVSSITLSYPGLDLAVGFVLSFGIKLLKPIRKLGLQDFPWQIGLLLMYLSFSTLLAVIRNLRQSASGTSIEGIIFNFIRFRPFAWHDDFMPVVDLIVYGAAGALIAYLVPFLLEKQNRNQLVFKPILLGLFATASLGIIQALTSFGLPEAYQDFRKDSLGFVAIGFQPDIHAYAGHLLLGAIGLWAYLTSTQNPKEKAWIYSVIGISWLALLLSKSRASLALAILSCLCLLVAYVWLERRKYFFRLTLAISCSVAIVAITLLYVIQYPQILASNGWFSELLNQYAVAGFAGLSIGTQNFGGRPEIYLAGIRMFSEFPILGLGQGGFFRQSADIEFSKSFMLSRWGGENAHNYFLQVLVENGLVGILIFMLVIVTPFFLVNSRKVLLPAALGLIALFLGNIFAHSFLVRENLILASVFIALMYAWVVATQKLDIHAEITLSLESLKRISFIGLGVIALIAAGALEAYHSFYRFPYQIGQRCFINKPLFSDGWSSGILEIPLPANSHGLRVHIAGVGRPDLHRRPLQARMDVAYYERYSHDHPPLATVFHEWKSPAPGILEIFLQDNSKLANGNGKAVIRLSNCFNPRDYGFSQDNRNLGVLIDRIEIF